MKAHLLVMSAVGLSSLLSVAHAYERETHRDLSEAALDVSALARLDLLAQIGLKENLRDAKVQAFPNSLGVSQSIVDLVRSGAYFEDGFEIFSDRPKNHFYNPLNMAGLSWGPIRGNPSPEWAVNGTGQKEGEEFSYRSARAHFLAALTSSSKTERDRRWGLTFQTLGHVIHHLQDMAQPQHVRNDPHLELSESERDTVCMDPDLCLSYHALRNPSLYEEWTNLTQIRSRLPTDFAMWGYDLADPKFAATFDRPLDFWEISAGIAWFTNQNFVSAGTNFDNPGMFNFPLFDPAKRVAIRIGDLCASANPPCPNSGLTGMLTFFGNDITDRYTGRPAYNPYASTYSIFSADLQKKGKTPVYTLNRFNFDLAHAFLIPRAIAHSAGMIDHFFRGRLDVVRNPIHPGIYRIRNLSAQTMRGTFTFYYDDADGNRRPVLNGQFRNVALIPFNPNDPASDFGAVFPVPTTPPPGIDGEYMLVFSGEMGEEKPADGVLGAVVGKYVAPPRSGFIVTPSYASADGISGQRLVSKKVGQWQLSSETGLAAGNIDWKGWYVNGIPTKVLTWRGPKSRYSRELPEKFAPEVYQDGEVFAVAPKPVLGAALNVDAQGRQWLVAITKGDEGEVVYRRPNAKSESPALYDAASNPSGWQEIGRITRPLFRVDRPWFFDGPGMGAQTVTTLSGGTGRLKLLVSSDGVATFSEILYVSSPPRLDVSDRPPPVTSSTSSGCANNTIQTRTVTTAEQRHDVENPGTGLLLAVDYDDTQELIAESVPYNVLYYRFKEVRTQERTDVFDSQDGKYLNCNSGIIAVTTGSDFYHSEEYNNVSFNNIQRLKFAGIQIDLNRPLDRMVEIKDQSLVGWVQYPSNPSQSTPGVSSSTTSRTRNSENNGWHFSYLNLRDRTALIYRQRSSSQSQFLNSVPVGGSNQADEQLDFHTAGSVTTYALGSGAPGSITLGPLQISDYDVGYAKDLVGNELYSIRFSSQVFNRGLMFYFNHLTGAVLEDLIPPGGPQPLYVPVGLVK